MKNKATPTSVERIMREADLIFSRTDPKGKITYANRVFVEFSGYTEDELIGSQHNIVRHPDMPRGVFKLMWDTLQSKQVCSAYVKNMSKDGSFYWVFATVTPHMDAAGNIESYSSWRAKPKASGVEAVKPLYAAMLNAEQEAGPATAPQASLRLLQEAAAAKGMGYEDFVRSL